MKAFCFESLTFMCLLPVSIKCWFIFQEHMILCRFADQTAVQLPPERRHIGTVFSLFPNVDVLYMMCSLNRGNELGTEISSEDYL